MTGEALQRKRRSCRSRWRLWIFEPGRAEEGVADVDHVGLSGAGRNREIIASFTRVVQGSVEPLADDHGENQENKTDAARIYIPLLFSVVFIFVVFIYIYIFIFNFVFVFAIFVILFLFLFLFFFGPLQKLKGVLVFASRLAGVAC